MDALRYLLAPATVVIGTLGFVLGGPYVWSGIAVFPVLMAADLLLPRDHRSRSVGSPALFDVSLYLHPLLMIGLYWAFLHSVTSGENRLAGAAAIGQILGSTLSLGWLNTVPNLPVSHEMWHRRHWLPRRLGQFLNTFFCDPNRDIGHVMVHHLHLDTPRDSDTARRGETLYAFVVRASVGAYLDAIRGEAQALRRRGLSPWNWRSRTYQQIVLLVALPGIGGAVAGPVAAAICLASMLIGKALAESFNYFQHYGLVRAEGGPIRLHHAWNHLGPVLRPLGVEITNHINHHRDGNVVFFRLRPEPDAPQMPSLFVCFLCGLVPPVWFRFIAKPRLAHWDRHFASPEERVLAMAANRQAGWPQWV